MQPVPSDADIAAATLKIGDLTTRFHVQRQTIYDWIKRAGFPEPIRVNARVVRWKPDAVDHWQNWQEHKARQLAERLA